MDHEINNIISQHYTYCVYLMWQKVLLKNIFDYFERIKKKYSCIKIIIIIIDYSLIVEKIEQSEYTMLVKLYKVHTLVWKNRSLPDTGLKKKKKVKLYVYKYVTKGSYRPVASKRFMVCIFNVLSKLFWWKTLKFMYYAMVSSI